MVSWGYLCSVIVAFLALTQLHPSVVGRYFLFSIKMIENSVCKQYRPNRDLGLERKERYEYMSSISQSHYRKINHNSEIDYYFYK